MSKTEEFKKDWITTLASSSGLMLTICLMVLTILYTASSISIHDWQKFVIAGSIVGASIYLTLCAKRSLHALGTLIFASACREKGDVANAEEAEKLTKERADKAQRSLTFGLWFLIAAIIFSFSFLNWSFFARMFNCIF